MSFEKTGHGGDVYGSSVRLDFSANINPLGTPESVRQAAAKSLTRIHQYPDPCCRRLVAAIAEREAVLPRYVLCGNGAAELIYAFCAAVRPKKVLIPAPAFSEYATALAGIDCTADRYLLRRQDEFAVTEAFLPVLRGERWDAVFLCNPNNPTGRLISPALLEEICRICEERSIRLFVDECFLDLSDDGGIHSLKGHLQRYPNLLLLKAFTKNYGMAGLRLGYCLCGDWALLERMSKTTQVWNVSTPAQEAGLAALSETGFLAEARTVIREERAFLARELENLGFWVCPSDANYLLFYSTQPLEAPLLAQGILIRNCANYFGLGDGWYRIAVKQRLENQQLLSALEQIMGG